MPFLRPVLFLVFLFTISFGSLAQQNRKTESGNPVFPGWYADPEGTIFGKKYWIYPTYSAPYNQQVFFDAFSSPDLVNWTKHSRILDSTAIKWAKRAMWAPAMAPTTCMKAKLVVLA